MLNTSDIVGGAARCAYRLHKGIVQHGVDSVYLVQNKFSIDEDIICNNSYIGNISAIIRPALDRLPIYYYPKRVKTYFSTGLVPNNISSKINRLSSDIINLHYIAEGFLPIGALRHFKKPVVWTFHDCWAFTGGCHLPGECDRYVQSCGACPLLSSENEHDLSYWIWRKKSKAWRNLNITIVTGSNWLADRVRSSSLFMDVEFIKLILALI
jgi:glycosyltransferase involved in cell wall biosynthesis